MTVLANTVSFNTISNLNSYKDTINWYYNALANYV